MPIELDDIRSGYNLSKINSNFQRIEDAWDEKLDRLVNDHGNQMEQQLDMNSNKIINHPPTDLEEPTDLVRVDALNQFDDFTGVVPVVASYTGNGVQVAFPKPVNANDARTFQVYVGGLRQEPYADYQIVGETVVFTQAPVLGVSVDIYGYSPTVIENGAPVYADPILANFTGDGTTTNFFVSAQGSGTDSAFISIDGVNQVPNTDFTNAGGAISFTEAPPLNSEIFVRIFAPFTNNATDSIVTATGATEPRTLGNHFTDEISVKDFGAVGDGVTNDTAAITAAINSPFTTILFPEGTYIIKSESNTDIICELVTNKSLILKGDNATIKIADDSEEYLAMIGSDNSLLEIPYFECNSLRFDCNKANQTYTIADNMLTYYNGGIKFRSTTEAYILNNTIVGAVSRQFFFFPTVTTVGGNRYLGDIIVMKGNYFLDVGRSDLDFFDSSLLYCNCRYADFSDNWGEGAGMGVTGAVSFIELHCEVLRMTNNYCNNFMNMGIITGITLETTIESIVTGNVCEVFRAGIILFSGDYLDHTSGYGIRGMLIANNNITIRQTALPGDFTFNTVGIGGPNGVDLNIEDVKIQNNLVKFSAESSELPYNSFIFGIGFPVASGDVLHKNIDISGNTIINAPAAAVVLGNGGGIFSNAHIGTNNIINPGQSLWSGQSSQSKSGVYIHADSVLNSITIDTQNIEDNYNTTRMLYGITFQVLNPSLSTEISAKADVKITGQDTTAFVQPFRLTTENVLPYCEGTCNIDFDFGIRPYKRGSTIRSITSGLTYTLPEDGVEFRSSSWGTGPLVAGLNYQGSHVRNIAPTLDGNNNVLHGWVCTTTGTPGVWQPMYAATVSV